MSEKDSQGFIERFTVRFPDGMRDAIAERARKNGRSMNSEIIQILEDALAEKDEGMQEVDLHTLREIIQIQADLLSQYSDAISQGTEILRAANSKNKKPT
nr:Arc family DNA-binding protein [Pantoea sp. 201603H]